MATKKARRKLTASFKVTMDLPTGVNLQMAQNYVREAVKAWKGGMDIDNPLFDIDPESVRVALLSTVTTYG